MNMKMKLVGLCLAMCLSAAAWAGEKAVERPLPQVFFNENTVLVAHLNLEAITSQRIIDAIVAIVPAEHRQDLDIEEMRGQLGMLDAMFGQLKQLGVTRATSISISKSSEDMNEMANYLLVPVSASLNADQKAQLTQMLNGIGQMGGMRAEPYSNWIVLHAEPSLPQESMDMSMRDAPFNDALKINPDHDIALVFVPTTAMVKAMKQGMAEAAAEAEGEAQDEVADLGVLAESEWYYVSVVLGGNPELYMSTRAKSPAKATQFAGAWDRALRAMKDAARKELAEDLAEAKKDKHERDIDYDPANYDPAPIDAMIDSLDAESKDTRMVIHMTRGEMKTFVNGVIVSVERLMDDLFSF